MIEIYADSPETPGLQTQLLTGQTHLYLGTLSDEGEKLPITITTGHQRNIEMQVSSPRDLGQILLPCSVRFAAVEVSKDVPFGEPVYVVLPSQNSDDALPNLVLYRYKRIE
ncbi:MAG: hypothetical protein AAB557_05230 [Patescibacteria group bacterium]